MAVAALANIEKTFGKRVLFDKLSLTIYPGERIGLIGDNGSGKTTLFRILSGAMIPDAGDVAVSRDTKLGYLTQDPVFDPGNSVIDEAELAFAELHRLSHRLRDLEHEMAGLEGEALERVLRLYQTAQHAFDLAGGYAWRHRLEATLLGVGLDRGTWEQSVTTLSGGQRSRLALARLLIAEPDLLLLDEPTNHLDLVAIEWLERYLLSFGGAVVLISHDRYLLDRLATRIVWLTQCRLKSYKGNYSSFVQQRELEELSQRRAFDQQQADIEKQSEFIRRFGAGQRSREAKGREKRLNRLLQSEELIQQVTDQRKIRLSLSTDQRAGDQVLDARELSKSYGEKVLWRGIGFHVTRGERAGIIGPNGSGKTTLLEVLLGERDADAGQIKWGANLRIGYYDQSLTDFDPDSTVIEEVWNGRDARQQEVRDVLATMLFRGEEVHKPVRLLSGGERARVRLAQLLLEKPNVLLLDEPTNHLDIASREALETALGQFPGTILCVSHDRYFLDKVIRRLLVLRPPDLMSFDGGYHDWAARESRQAAEAGRKAEESSLSRSKREPSLARASEKPSPRKDNPYLRPFGRLSTENLEREIHDTEVALAECQQDLTDPATYRDPGRSQSLNRDLQSLGTKLKQLEEEYFAREE